MRYRFEDFSLDPNRRELRRNENLHRVEPQVFDLLLHLVRHRDRLVSREELFQTIWNGRIISESVLSTRIHAARLAIGDNGKDQRLIRTLHGRGARFVGAVHEESATAGAQPGAPAAQRSSILGERPAIAVLPFVNLSGDCKQDCVADWMTEELIIGLSRAGWLSVASRASSLSCGRAIPATEVARKLGVRYLLEGGMRQAGGRTRITARLIDALADHQLWVERYERDADAAFAVLDEIVDQVLGAVEPQLYFAEEFRARHTSTDDLNAWECIVRALSLMNSREKPHIAAARVLLQKAVSLDGQSAAAHSLLSILTTLSVHMGWGQRQLEVPRALAAARAALSLNTEEPWAHAALGYAMIWRHPGEAILPLERAVALNPNFAIGHYFLALASTYAGHRRGVFDRAAKAETLARRDLLARGFAGAHNNVRATAAFAEEHYRDGIRFARSAVRDLPKSPSAYRALVINLALGGETEEARRALQTLKGLAPDMSHRWIAQNAVWNPNEAMKRYVEAFRVAGLYR